MLCSVPDCITCALQFFYICVCLQILNLEFANAIYALVCLPVKQHAAGN